MRCLNGFRGGMMIVGLAYSSVCFSNTSAQDVLEDSVVEVVAPVVEVTSEEQTDENVAVSDEAETPVENNENPVENLVNDYGDEILNQLYAE